MSEVTRLTIAEWEAIGTERFGPDKLSWRFACPACGHVQTPEDFRVHEVHAETALFSCIGRWAGPKRKAFGGEGAGPCDYTSGGLINIAPIIVKGPDGEEKTSFAFAEAA